MCTNFMSPELIVLDYYDGATEGIFRSKKERVVRYFRMIAWDENQEKRLYAMHEGDSDPYRELVRILLRNGEDPSCAVWMPKWKFTEKSDEERANEIVEDLEKKLLDSRKLMLGFSFDGTHSKEIDLDDSSMKVVRNILSRGYAENMANLSSEIKFPM